MIKAIIFDAGGVIIKEGSHLDVISEYFDSKDKQKLWQKLNQMAGPLCRGKITEKEYWKKVAKSEGIDSKKIPDNLWVKGYKKHTEINSELMRLIKNLKTNYTVILLSNTIKSHVKINKKRKLFDPFDDVINSNEVHLSKHDQKIFELVLERNQLESNQCVFIDDIKDFVEIANQIGMHGILYKDIDQLKKKLLEIGVKID